MSQTQEYWRYKRAFEHLLELAPEVRAAYLAELGKKEPELSNALASRLAR